MDSPQVNSTDKDRQMAGMKRNLEEATKQLRHKDSEHQELLEKYRRKKRELRDKDDEIDALKAKVQRLEADAQLHQPEGNPEQQSEIDNFLGCLKNNKEYKAEESQEQSLQRTIDDVNNRCLQSSSSAQEMPKKGIHTPFTADETDKVIDYIFNIHKPLPSFTKPYWSSLTSQLEKDQVTSRTVNSIKKLFWREAMFELYKRKELHTAEHRKIAVMAFQKAAQTFHKELTEQYDFARLPYTTDKQVEQMESLAWKKTYKR